MWTEALMHRHPIDVIYLDYAKAVDTVPNQRLLRQIYSLGIQGVVYQPLTFTYSDTLSSDRQLL